MRAFAGREAARAGRTSAPDLEPLPLLPSGPDGVRGQSSRRCKREPPLNSAGGEGGIRTLEHLLGCYSLSRRAPSTTRPPLLAAARVPEPTSAIKSYRWPLYSWEPAGSAAEYPGTRPSDRAAAAPLPPWESARPPEYSAYPSRGALSAGAPIPRVDTPAQYDSRGSAC